MIKQGIFIALMTSLSVGAMMQYPLEVEKRHKSFFISPYTQADTYKIPFIGVYGKPYVMLYPLARIKFEPRMLQNAPQSIKELIPPQALDLSFNGIITPLKPQTYNMVFHTWAETWQKEKLFDIQMPMGIFEANGVQPASSTSIPFGKLTPQRVWVHNGGKTIAYSPPNARFTVSGQRDISTFWSIAISSDKQHAIVTFHILANTPAVENMIETTVRSAKTLGDFLQELKRGARIVQKPIDQQALQDAIRTLESILVVRQAPVQPFAPATVDTTLEDSLKMLTQNLNRLAQQLNT